MESIFSARLLRLALFNLRHVPRVLRPIIHGGAIMRQLPR